MTSEIPQAVNELLAEKHIVSSLYFSLCCGFLVLQNQKKRRSRSVGDMSNVALADNDSVGELSLTSGRAAQMVLFYVRIHIRRVDLDVHDLPNDLGAIVDHVDKIVDVEKLERLCGSRS